MVYTGIRVYERVGVLVLRAGWGWVFGRVVFLLDVDNYEADVDKSRVCGVGCLLLFMLFVEKEAYMQKWCGKVYRYNIVVFFS